MTDNNVGWFTCLVSIFETGEVVETLEIPSGLTNEYMSNLFNREPSFLNSTFVIPNSSLDTFTGIFISKYDFDRIKKLVELYPNVLEYNRLGKLEKIN